MSSHADVMSRFEDVAIGRAERFLQGTNLLADVVDGMPVLFSYGRHFPLIEVLPKGEHGRTRPLVLMNGDRFSVTTSHHQNMARSSGARIASNICGDSLLLPYSALEAAGIVRATIRPLEVRPDRMETLEAIPVTVDLDDVGSASSSIEYEDAEIGGRLYRWHDARGRLYLRRQVARERDCLRRGGHYDATGTAWPQWWTPEARAAGAIACEPQYGEWREIPERLEPPQLSRSAPGDGWTTLEPGDGGGYVVKRRQHFLGDSLFTARARGRRRKFLSSFDTNEPHALYFLAELPRTPAATVAAAVDSLAPAAVHAALAQGRDVRRQGDIFYIPTELADSEIYARARTRARLTQWTHSARPKRGEVGFVDRATRRRRVLTEYRRLRRWTRVAPTLPRRPWCFNRSDWELLHAVPRNGMETWERDKLIRGRTDGPSEWQLVDWRREVTRWKARAGRQEPWPAAYAYAQACATVDQVDSRKVRAALTVYGTAHTATEVVHARNGAVYVRGIVRHVPAITAENRQRDHVAQKLASGVWHLAIRNTVPRNSADRGNR